MVWITPDAALTKMPREAYPTASDLVAEARPPLVSAASTRGVPKFATSAMARWVSQKNPARLTRTVA